MTIVFSESSTGHMKQNSAGLLRLGDSLPQGGPALMRCDRDCPCLDLNTI